MGVFLFGGVDYMLFKVDYLVQQPANTKLFEAGDSISSILTDGITCLSLISFYYVQYK